MLRQRYQMMDNYNFELVNSSYAHQIMQKSGANGLSFFLFDSSIVGNNAISFIYHSHLSDATLYNYASQIYQYDPLMPHKQSLIRNCDNYTGVSMRESWRKKDAPPQENTRRYWDFFKTLDYIETAASFKAVSSNIFMVIGLVLAEKNKHLSVEPVMQQMEDWLSESCDHIIETSLRSRHEFAGKRSKNSRIDQLSEQLTTREFQVVCELLQGKSNKQIAYALRLSEYTVENYLRKIYKKFGVRNRTALMATIGH